MIKLNETHRSQLLEYLRQDPVINLFLIGDLGLFGFDDTIQEYYGTFEIESLTAVFFRYRDQGTHLYADVISDDTVSWIRKFIEKNPTVDFLMGEKTHACLGGRLDGIFESNKAMKLSAYTPNDIVINTDGVVRLGACDAKALGDLQNQAFGGTRQDSSSIESSLEDGSLVTYGMFIDGTLVSCASSTAQTQDAAMIIGVATDMNHREKGYASAVVKKMSDDLYAQGVQGVLFYDNPKAARIYERMGYQMVSGYFMNKLKK